MKKLILLATIAFALGAGTARVWSGLDVSKSRTVSVADRPDPRSEFRV